MKLLLVPAIVLLSLPGATVRFESDGVRVGDEVVSTKTIGLKSSGDLPILVSGSSVENLSLSGSALEVAIDGKSVLLDVGIRMERQGDGYRLSTHGPAFSVESDGKSLAFESAATFKATEKGFDFGKQGTLEGSALAAKVATTVAVQDRPAQPEPPLRAHSRPQSRQRDPAVLRRVFNAGDPTIAAEAADGQAIRMLLHVSPTGSP